MNKDDAELRADLTNLFFRTAGGISDMAQAEVDKAMQLINQYRPKPVVAEDKELELVIATALLPHVGSTVTLTDEWLTVIQPQDVIRAMVELIYARDQQKRQELEAAAARNLVSRLSAWAVDADLTRGSGSKVTFALNDWNEIRHRLAALDQPKAGDGA